MKGNDVCTVFNKIYDPIYRKYIFQPTVVEGVFWQEKVEARNTQEGLHEANEVHIFIPFMAKAQRSFAKLEKFGENPTAHFTLLPEDKIMNGVSSGISLTIVSVSTFDYGSKGLKHWEVVAK
ncbi:hypothetical protein [Anaerotignum sp.]|uniref:hypothetical protein n=1 Tax=Anaerotignum sp. TaxID=2039241 RepID=UPI003318390F